MRKIVIGICRFKNWDTVGKRYFPEIFICLHQNCSGSQHWHEQDFTWLFFSRNSHGTIYPCQKCRGISVRCFQRNPPPRKGAGENYGAIYETIIINHARVRSPSAPRSLHCFRESKIIKPRYWPGYVTGAGHATLHDTEVSSIKDNQDDPRGRACRQGKELAPKWWNFIKCSVGFSAVLLIAVLKKSFHIFLDDYGEGTDTSPMHH
jgi:hypothetical protein